MGGNPANPPTFQCRCGVDAGQLQVGIASVDRCSSCQKQIGGQDPVLACSKCRWTACLGCILKASNTTILLQPNTDGHIHPCAKCDPVNICVGAWPSNSTAKQIGDTIENVASDVITKLNEENLPTKTTKAKAHAKVNANANNNNNAVAAAARKPPPAIKSLLLVDERSTTTAFVKFQNRQIAHGVAKKLHKVTLNGRQLDVKIPVFTGVHCWSCPGGHGELRKTSKHDWCSWCHKNRGHSVACYACESCGVALCQYCQDSFKKTTTSCVCGQLHTSSVPTTITYQCDLCLTPCPSKTLMQGCRQCDYDVCLACVVEGSPTQSTFAWDRAFWMHMCKHLLFKSIPQDVGAKAFMFLVQNSFDPHTLCDAFSKWNNRCMKTKRELKPFTTDAPTGLVIHGNWTSPAGLEVLDRFYHLLANLEAFTDKQAMEALQFCFDASTMATAFRNFFNAMTSPGLAQIQKGGAPLIPITELRSVIEAEQKHIQELARRANRRAQFLQASAAATAQNFDVDAYKRVTKIVAPSVTTTPTVLSPPPIPPPHQHHHHQQQQQQQHGQQDGKDNKQQHKQPMHVPGFDGRKNWKSPNQAGMETQKLFPVDPTSDEYRMIVAEVNKTLHNKIKVIERVENGLQHEQFSITADAIKRKLQQNYDPKSMRQLLFHGSKTSDALQNIVHNPSTGFNPLLAGSSTGALYGEGTYFARDASYSHQYANVLPSGERQMLLVEVALGAWAPGRAGMKNYPLVAGKQYERYDSLVNDTKWPTVFVVQQSSQAYPAYVITYEDTHDGGGGGFNFGIGGGGGRAFGRGGGRGGGGRNAFFHGRGPWGNPQPHPHPPPAVAFAHRPLGVPAFRPGGIGNHQQHQQPHHQPQHQQPQHQPQNHGGGGFGAPAPAPRVQPPNVRGAAAPKKGP